MKKRSFSLGEGGIKQLAAEHVEKVMFAGLILVGLSLMYFAFKQKSVSEDMVPSKLIGEAKQAGEFIHRDSWQENADRFPVKLDVKQIVQDGMGEEIASTEYISVAGNPTIGIKEQPQLNKRMDPKLLTPFDLQAKGMFGTIPWKKPADKTILNELVYGSLRVPVTDSRTKDQEEKEEDDSEPEAIGFDVRPAAGQPGGDGIMTTVPMPIEREMDGVRATGSDAKNVGIQGHYFVCVTALVPFRQQIIEFQTLQGTEGYSSEVDYPRYARLEVERMDLDAPTPQFVDITNQVNVLSDSSATNYPEVCDPDHFDPRIALPMLPFLRHDPTRMALHPLIPAKKWLEEKEDEEEEGETKSGDAFDLTATPDVDGGAKTVDGDSSGKMQAMMDAMAGRGGNASSDESTANLVLTPDQAPEFKLVRFFDVIMAPGKRYQYRVRLRLYDPNLPASLIKRSSGIDTEIAVSDEAGPGRGRQMEDMMKEMGNKSMGEGGQGGGAMQLRAIEVKHGNSRVQESMLDDSVRQRLRDLQASPDFASEDENVRFGIPTAWSEPSNEIVSPARSEQYFAGAAVLDKEHEAKGVKFTKGEPKVELAISVWDPTYMYYLPGYAEVRRGSTLNLQQVVKLVHPIDLTIREIQGRKIKASGRVKEDTYEGHALDSEAVVIDITGGEKLPNKTRSSTDFFAPSEVLVFDGESFSVQDELEDKRLFRENSLFQVQEDEQPSMPAGVDIGGGGEAFDPFGGGK